MLVITKWCVTSPTPRLRRDCPILHRDCVLVLLGNHLATAAQRQRTEIMMSRARKLRNQPHQINSHPPYTQSEKARAAYTMRMRVAGPAQPDESSPAVVVPPPPDEKVGKEPTPYKAQPALSLSTGWKRAYPL